MNPVCFFDAPVVLDCSVTTIPGSGSSPVQVVASLPIDVTRIEINDAVGEHVGLYVGPIGAERLHTIICSGSRFPVQVFLTKGSRISLGSLSVTAITVGSICVTFIG